MTILDKNPLGEYHGTGDIRSRDFKDPWGKYYWTDILEGLPALVEEYQGKIQLVYIDPPFMTGQLFKYKQKIGDKGSIEHIAYRDQWKEGREDYLAFMRQIIEHIYRLLTPEGSLYLHVDYRTSAYLRIILDDIFGYDNFINEIIWHYQTGGRAKRHFSRKHDTIFFYRKSPKHYFNIDAVGVKRGAGKKNNMKKNVDEEGRVFWSIKSGGKIYRYYEDSKVYPSDVWTDIPHLHQRDPERTGYDTQKPEALLERIILSSSGPGDYVVDFFAGSGTTLATAQKHGRRWMGIDSSPHSMYVCRNRLLDLDDEKDFIIYYGNSNPAQSQPILTLDIDGENYAGRKKISPIGALDNPNHIRAIDYVRLLDYIPAKDAKVHTRGDNHIKLKGIQHINYWGLGYISDGLFYPVQWSTRNNKGEKAIDDTLYLKGFARGDLTIHIVDVWGNQYFYS